LISRKDIHGVIIAASIIGFCKIKFFDFKRFLGLWIRSSVGSEIPNSSLKLTNMIYRQQLMDEDRHVYPKH
jgi:hypothetical protein